MTSTSVTTTPSTRSTATKMGRTSLSQPQHRRPEWAKTEASYKANIKITTNRRYGPATDHGLDNFSFDPAHLPDYYIPEDLIESMPEELAKAAVKWMYAGAALETAFDRIEQLAKDSVEPAEHPDPGYSDLRRLSDADGGAEASAGANTTTTVVAAPIPSYNTAAHNNNTKLSVNPYSGMPSRIAGMETPPFTPVDTRGPGTPSNSHTPAVTTGSIFPDLSRLNAQLYPLTAQISPPDSDCSARRSSATSISSIALEMKNNKAMAWEGYAKTWNAELYDLKYNSFPRFAGVDRRIHKLFIELEGEEKFLDGDVCVAVCEFRRRFGRMEGKVRSFQERVRALEEVPLF